MASAVNSRAVLDCCRALSGASEEFPFGPQVTVFKVGAKVFAIVAADSVSLKCDPARAIVLREQYTVLQADHAALLRKQRLLLDRLETGGAPVEHPVTALGPDARL